MTSSIGTLEDLEVPQSLGVTFFRPTIEAVKKFAYAVEDESGWLVGDPKDGIVHPIFLATYLWWPSGFYVREAGAVGHFTLFQQRFHGLVGRPHLHAKTAVRFGSPFPIGARLSVEVIVTEKYRKRSRDFVVLTCAFRDSGDMPVATYTHTVAIRSHWESRVDIPQAGPSFPLVATSEMKEDLPQRRTVHLSLEKSRLFTLPAENFHTHDRYAQQLGLRVAVAPAMMSLAYLSQYCTDELGSEWLSGGFLQAVFIKMLQRDDVLTIHGRDRASAGIIGESSRTLELRIDNAQGEPVAAGSAGSAT